MELGERLGAENFAGYFKQFGLLSKTNIDLPGEAGTIMHKTENIGPVELATISFGQSFSRTGFFCPPLFYSPGRKMHRPVLPLPLLTLPLP